MTENCRPTRRRVLGILGAAGGVGLLPAQVRASQVIGPGELEAALSAAAPGTVLLLMPGDCDTLTFRGGGGRPRAPVTLAAADPTQPPRFARMDIRDAAHLVLEGLHFNYTFTAGDKRHFRPFDIRGSRDITVRNCLFDGDRPRGVSVVDDGFGWACGFGVTDIAGLVIDSCEIRDFHRGLAVRLCRDVAVTGNNVHDLRMDGMSFVQVQDVRIERNYIHDFNRSLESGDHADMIQFWTNKTDAPSTDVVIRGNLLSSGRGAWTQSIFMGNEEVRSGRAGREMFYRNILIEENVIANAHLHGITVGETDGLVIRQNTVLRNPLSEGEDDNPPLWTPTLRAAPAARDVTIARNVVAAVGGYEGQSDWRVSENMPVQDRTRMEPGFFDLLFEGDPADPASLRYKPGGPLDGAGIGATVLQRA